MRHGCKNVQHDAKNVWHGAKDVRHGDPIPQSTNPPIPQSSNHANPPIPQSPIQWNIIKGLEQPTDGQGDGQATNQPKKICDS